MPNQWTKAKETGKPYILKDTTRELLSKATKNKNNNYWANPENKIKHSLAMKQAVEKYPSSYTGSNRGRVKQIEIDGIKLHGSWELEFYLYCKNKNIKINKCVEYFLYEWNGTRKYFPDFYLPHEDLYVEIKGYETERDRAKWSYFPNKLLILKKKDILQIKQNNFLPL